jgi:BASS family bile acid:Na+ symporter
LRFRTGTSKVQGAVLTLLRTLLVVAVAAFAVSTMLAVGLGHTLREMFGPMLDARGVVRALLANFVLVPLLAYGVLRVVRLDASYATGLMLIATAAGAPFAIKLTAVARGNVPLSASLTMLLLPATVLYMPLVVPMLVPQAEVSPAAITFPLLWTMIVPLGVGLFTRARRQALAERLRPWLGRFANVSLIVLVAATVITNLGGVARLIDTGAIFAPLVLILGAYVIGWVFGREYRGGHVVLGLGTAQRNIAAAMVVATEGLDDRDTVVMVVVASLLELAVLFPIAWFLSRRGRRNRRLRHGDVARAGA